LKPGATPLWANSTFFSGRPLVAMLLLQPVRCHRDVADTRWSWVCPRSISGDVGVPAQRLSKTGQRLCCTVLWKPTYLWQEFVQEQLKEFPPHVLYGGSAHRRRYPELSHIFPLFLSRAIIVAIFPLCSHYQKIDYDFRAMGTNTYLQCSQVPYPRLNIDEGKRFKIKRKKKKKANSREVLRGDGWQWDQRRLYLRNDLRRTLAPNTRSQFQTPVQKKVAWKYKINFAWRPKKS